MHIPVTHTIINTSGHMKCLNTHSSSHLKAPQSLSLEHLSPG